MYDVDTLPEVNRGHLLQLVLDMLILGNDFIRIYTEEGYTFVRKDSVIILEFETLIVQFSIEKTSIVLNEDIIVKDYNSDKIIAKIPPKDAINMKLLTSRQEQLIREFLDLLEEHQTDFIDYAMENLLDITVSFTNDFDGDLSIRYKDVVVNVFYCKEEDVYILNGEVLFLDENIPHPVLALDSGFLLYSLDLLN